MMKKAILGIAAVIACALITTTSATAAPAKADETEQIVCTFLSESDLATFETSGTTLQNGVAQITNGYMQTKDYFSGAISYVTLAYQTGFSITYGENSLNFDGTSVTLGGEQADLVLPQGEFTLFFRFLQGGVRIGVATEEDYADKLYETAASFVWSTEQTANKLGIKASEGESVSLREWKIYTLAGVISGDTENYDPDDTMRPIKDVIETPSDTNNGDGGSGCGSSGALNGSGMAIASSVAVVFADKKRRGIKK